MRSVPGRSAPRARSAPTAANTATISKPARLAKLPNLKVLYLTETQVSPAAVAAFRKQHPNTFVSWAKRPAPRGAPLTNEKPVIEEMQ